MPDVFSESIAVRGRGRPAPHGAWQAGGPAFRPKKNGLSHFRVARALEAKALTLGERQFTMGRNPITWSRDVAAFRMAEQTQTYVARQPIFDRQLRVFGYELLFRAGLESVGCTLEQEQASSRVIATSFFSHGVERLTEGRWAFVNVTRDSLLSRYAVLLPRELAVIEILETVVPDEPVIDACRALRRAGYTIALDDFVDGDHARELISLADIVKVDFLGTTPSERLRLANALAVFKGRLVAEKIETWEAYQEAIALGYHYFQGYFFSKPMIIDGREIRGSKLHYLQLISEVNAPDIDFERLERVIKSDLSLTYKLLKCVNSAYYAVQNRISSVHQALVLLGRREIRKWATLVALTNIGHDKPEELLRQAVVRARLCERLAEHVGLRDRDQELFLLGMLSLVDAVLDTPLAQVLAGLPLSRDIEDALLGKPNRLRDVIECVVAFERADWSKLAVRTVRLGIPTLDIAPLYREAIAWSHDAYGTVSVAA